MRIAELGLASSLGGLVPAAAAYRAGFSRAKASPEILVDGQPIPAHAAWPEAFGYDQVGAWRRLAEQAIAEVASTMAWPTTSGWARTAVILALPSIDPDRFGWTVEDPITVLGPALLDPMLAGIAAERVPASLRCLIAGGHVAVAQALEASRAWFANGTCDRVLLIAVDTCLDPSSLGWLGESARLQCDDQPHGLIPGEAAVCLLLEPDREGAGPRVVATAVEPRPVADDEPREPPVVHAQRARGAWQRCVATAGRAPGPLDQYVDVNGEAWRSGAWGTLVAQVAMPTGGREWFPAQSFGETGAASPALALALAVRSWERGYAGADDAVIWSWSERGDAAAILLSAR